LLSGVVVYCLHTTAALPEWFENIMKAFHYSDPKGVAFRYGITEPKEELYADMHPVKTLMNWLSASFKRIKVERLKADY
jgi:hypothetical protein